MAAIFKFRVFMVLISTSDLCAESREEINLEPALTELPISALKEFIFLLLFQDEGRKENHVNDKSRLRKQAI